MQVRNKRSVVEVPALGAETSPLHDPRSYYVEDENAVEDDARTSRRRVKRYSLLPPHHVVGKSPIIVTHVVRKFLLYKQRRNELQTFSSRNLIQF